MQSIEWMMNDIKSREKWQQDYYHFDEHSYSEDEEYKTEKDEEYEKYVARLQFRNELVNQAIDSFKKVIAKNI